jgi:predicted kinase
MKTIILTKGLPGSGKTTWALQQLEKHPGKYKRINKDSLRAMLDGGKHSKHRETFIVEARNALIAAALNAGYSVIVDDTNLSARHEDDIRERFESLANIEIKDFTDVPLETCIERDRHRPNYVGEQVIRRMHRDFLQKQPEIYLEDPTLSLSIICDLDGTLALLHGRDPYDASTCEEDWLNPTVADIVRRYAGAGQHVLLVSGRKECHREPTERWLQHHKIPYTALWMRQTEDNRPDSIVKQEIFEHYIRGRHYVYFVLDDRNSVVQLWRSLGLTCLQVADGDF